MAKRAHHDDPREEPPIRELEIEAGNERSDLRASAPKPGSGAVIVVLVAAVAAIVGITYGFLLGRGDRELVSQTSVAGTTTTTRFTPTTAVPVVGEIRVQFVRTAPGRDLGIGVTEYLNANLFTTLTADSDGIIWAGGNSGVVRLDPATGEFTKLTDTDGTGPVNVISIAAAPDGSVWVTSDRGLSHWREGAWTDDSRFSSAGGTERWPGALALGDDGTVWLATHQWGSGGERAQIHHSRAPFLGDIPTSTFDHFVQAIEIDQEGRVWILTNRRLWQFDGEWHPTLEPGPRWFHAMAADAAGVLWFGAEDRIFRWDGDDLSERFWGAPTPDPADPMAVQSWIAALAASPGGGIWALTLQSDQVNQAERSDLVRLGDGPAATFPLPDGFDANQPGGLAVTPDGAVWVAGGPSLLRFDGQEWRGFRIEDEPPIERPGSLAVGPSGEVWAASSEGIVHHRADGWHAYDLEDFGLEPADDPAFAAQQFWVTAGPHQAIWGGIGCRAFRFAAENWQPLPLPPDVTGLCWHTTVTVTPDGFLWMSPAWRFERAPVYSFDGEEWQVLETSLPEVTDLAVTPDGTVWLATLSGISDFDGERWSTDKSGVQFSAVAVAGNGTIWAASQWSERPGLWRNYGDGWFLTRPGAAIEALATGPDGTVWALETRSDGASSLLDTNTGQVRLITDAGGLHTLTIGTDGTFWSAGDGRLYRIDPFG